MWGKKSATLVLSHNQSCMLILTFLVCINTLIKDHKIHERRKLFYPLSLYVDNIMANIRKADLFWIMDTNISWILHPLSGNQQIKERQKENRVRRRNNSMFSNNVPNVDLLICVLTQQFFFQKSKGALRKVNHLAAVFKFLFFHEYLLSNLFCRISATLPIVANWIFRQGP